MAFSCGSQFATPIMNAGLAPAAATTTYVVPAATAAALSPTGYMSSAYQQVMQQGHHHHQHMDQGVPKDCGFPWWALLILIIVIVILIVWFWIRASTARNNAAIIANQVQSGFSQRQGQFSLQNLFPEVNTNNNVAAPAVSGAGSNVAVPSNPAAPIQYSNGVPASQPIPASAAPASVMAPANGAAPTYTTNNIISSASSTPAMTAAAAAAAATAATTAALSNMNANGSAPAGSASNAADAAQKQAYAAYYQRQQQVQAQQEARQRVSETAPNNYIEHGTSDDLERFRQTHQPYIALYTMQGCNGCEYVQQSLRSIAGDLAVPILVIDSENLPDSEKCVHYPYVYIQRADGRRFNMMQQANPQSIKQFVAYVLGRNALKN